MRTSLKWLIGGALAACAVVAGTCPDESRSPNRPAVSEEVDREAGAAPTGALADGAARAIREGTRVLVRRSGVAVPATVSLFGQRASGPWRQRFSSEAPEGEVVLDERLEPDALGLAVAHLGGGEVAHCLLEPPRSASPGEVVIEVPASFELTGTTVTLRGEALPSVQLTLEPYFRAQTSDRLLDLPVEAIGAFASDERGAFRTRAPRGLYRLTASAAGHASLERILAVPAAQPLELRLGEAGFIEGVVQTADAPAGCGDQREGRRRRGRGRGEQRRRSVHGGGAAGRRTPAGEGARPDRRDGTARLCRRIRSGESESWWRRWLRCRVW